MIIRPLVGGNTRTRIKDKLEGLPGIKAVKFEGDFNASPKIWEDEAGFKAKIDDFTKAVADAKAKIKDIDSLKANVPALGKACGGCHETFRVKNS